MAFKSVVSDYYYSSDGDYAWKKDRLTRWVLSVKSVLPPNTTLRLKRRIHRAAELYDLRKFASIDEAMRYTIAYVTEYPQSNLSAVIYNSSKAVSLRANISTHYQQTSNDMLSSSITSVGNTVVVSERDSITKL